jgi:hypothetical protein
MHLHKFRQARRKMSSRSQAIQATAEIALLSSASAADSCVRLKKS